MASISSTPTASPTSSSVTSPVSVLSTVLSTTLSTFTIPPPLTSTTSTASNTTSKSSKTTTIVVLSLVNLVSMYLIGLFLFVALPWLVRKILACFGVRFTHIVAFPFKLLWKGCMWLFHLCLRLYLGKHKFQVRQARKQVLPQASAVPFAATAGVTAPQAVRSRPEIVMGADDPITMQDIRIEPDLPGAKDPDKMSVRTKFSRL